MKNNIKKVMITLIGLIALPVYAGTTTMTMSASAKLLDSCTLSVSDVVFGNYNPNANIDQTTTQSVNIRCTKGTPWNLYEYALYYPYAGATNSTGYASAMLYSGNKLYYQVQMSDGVWDNDIDMSGRPNSGHFVGTGTGQTQNLTMNFRILKNQYVSPGNYIDAATVYIAF